MWSVWNWADWAPRSFTWSGVQGIANFGFPTEFPDDTTFSVQYRVQAPAGSVGLILFTVTAMDELEFRSHANRTYRLE